MSKRRIHSTRSQTNRSLSSLAPKKQETPLQKHFVGLSLSGGKSDKSSLAIFEYYSEQKRLFLAHLEDRIKPEETVSADRKIHDFISERSASIESVVIDAPLSFPKCLRCDLPCPGFETCNEPEIKWMRAIDLQKDKKKPKRHFTPYTQRAVEMFLSKNMDEKFDIQDAMGANLAPLTSRAYFISRRLEVPVHETMTKLSVWKMGLHFKINRSLLKKWWNSVGGEEARKIILTNLAEKANIFFYQQDLKLMTENLHAFEAMICAYVGLLKHQGRVEPSPKDFPPEEGWVEIPYFGAYSK